jgi:hypothetical protein
MGIFLVFPVSEATALGSRARAPHRPLMVTRMDREFATEDARDQR